MFSLEKLLQPEEDIRTNEETVAEGTETVAGGSPFLEEEAYERKESEEKVASGALFSGDNLALMHRLLTEHEMRGKLQCIYVDPPFFTKANYLGSFKVNKELPSVKPPSYEDKWQEGMEEYLEMFGERLLCMKELLADDGLIWVHLDWHVVHYVKVLMDRIFGAENFINEIIWQYKSGGSSKKHFSRKHDTILLYSKSKKYKLFVGKEKSYNRGYKPYRFKGVEEFCDDIGWYTMVNQKDIWQIDMVGRTSSERTGYATQKPVALMKRIIESSTEPGDLCADFFCGAGGFAEAAASLERPWIACDMSDLAAGVVRKRMLAKNYGFMYCRQESETEHPLEFGITAERNPMGMLTVSLEEQPIKLTDLPFETSDLPKVEAYCEKTDGLFDGRKLLAYWTIDTDYDGEFHRDRHVMLPNAKDKETVPPFSFAGMTETKCDEVSVLLVDILGHSLRKTVRVKNA